MAVAVVVASTTVGCAFTLEVTGAMGPKAIAELRADVAPVPLTQKVTTTTDPLFGPPTTTVTEGLAQPPTKSVSKGSDAPKLNTFVGTILAWLAGLF